MSLLSTLFGGKQTTTQSVDVDPRYQAFLNRNLDRSESAFDGFNPYTRQRIANFTDDENLAFDRIRGISDPTGLSSQVESQGLERFLGAPSLDDLQGFTNPFQDAVIDNSARRVYDQYDKEISNIRNQAADMGAFGGSRFAVAESEALDNLGQTIGDIAYRGESDNFNQAIGRYYDTAGAGIAAAGQTDNQAFGRAQQLLGVGQNRRGLEQAGLDFDFSEFMRGETTDRQDALSLAEIGQAYPRDIFDRTTTQNNPPGILNAVAGLGGSLFGLGQTAGLFGGGGSGGGGGIVNPFAGGGGGGSPSGFSNIGGGYSGGVSPSLQAIGYQPGQFTQSLAGSFGGGYAEGGEVTSEKSSEDDTFQELFDGIYNRRFGPLVTGLGNIFEDFTGDREQSRVTIPLSEEEKKQIQDYYDNQKIEQSRVTIPLSEDEQQFVQNYHDGLFDRIPTPRLKPPVPNNVQNQNVSPFSDPSDGPVTIDYKNPFVDQNRTQNEQEKEKDPFMDRWLDNPFTQFGLAMLGGTDTDLGKSANILMNQRAQARNQERDDLLRQQQLEQERERLAQQQAVRSAEAQANLEMQQRQLEFQREKAQKSLEDSAADRAARMAMAEMTSKGKSPDSREGQLELYSEELDRNSQVRNDLQDELRALAVVMGPDAQARKNQIQQELLTLDERNKMIRNRIEVLADVDFGDRDREPSQESSKETSFKDPLGLGFDN